MDNELQDKMIHAIIELQADVAEIKQNNARMDAKLDAGFGKMDEFLQRMKRNDEEIVALRATTDRHEEELVALKETIAS